MTYRSKAFCYRVLIPDLVISLLNTYFWLQTSNFCTELLEKQQLRVARYHSGRSVDYIGYTATYSNLLIWVRAIWPQWRSLCPSRGEMQLCSEKGENEATFEEKTTRHDMGSPVVRVFHFQLKVSVFGSDVILQISAWILRPNRLLVSRLPTRQWTQYCTVV